MLAEPHDYRLDIRSNPNSTHVALHTAMRLAFRYAKRQPTHQELTREFGMSRATAYRWIAAIAEAKLLEGMAGSSRESRTS